MTGDERRRPDLPTRAKRLLDVIGASAALVVAAPLVAAAVFWIWARSPGPAIFRQFRRGRDGVPFVMYKLRTMRLDADDALAAHLEAAPADAEEWRRYRRLRHDPRLIPGAGRLLRTFSIDEIPQLWNVIRGDMSLVGPRPLELALTEQLPAELRAIRDTVRPGITGLWQVSGRSETDIVTLVHVDADYVRDWSLWTDFTILLRTPAAVLSRRGAY